MSFVPPVNRGAIVLVRHSTAGTVPVGRGVVFTGSVAADSTVLITAPSGADGAISGVTYELSCDDTNAGLLLLAGLSIVQLRVGSTSVAFGDRLNLQDATGVWQPAPPLSQNVYYYALQAGSAGALIWAAPVASRPL